MIISVVLFAAMLALFGPWRLLFIPIQMAFNWWQLTMANYIEHYGLLHQKLPNGRHEIQQPRYSWNSNHIVSNLILFHLQRHSDHDAHPTRSYQPLHDFKDLPALPTGYLKWICLICGHIYDEKEGDPFEGVAPGPRFADIPDSLICPDCGTTKEGYILFEGE